MSVDVSVVIPCFNCENTIKRSFESIMEQSELPNEVIFVNDCSTDSTLDVLSAIKSEYESSKVSIIIIDLTVNSGPATARNIGWNKAFSSYVAFLDADDAWYNKKLEIQYEFMVKNRAELTGHYVEILGPDSVGSIQQHAIQFKAKCITFDKLLFKNYFPTPTVMVKRDLPNRFPEGLYFAEDYQLWLDIAYNSPLFLIPINLCSLHKPAFGYSGLSSKLKEMERGVQLVFRHLYERGRISRLKYGLVMCFSNAKYLRRLFITRFSK